MTAPKSTDATLAIEQRLAKMREPFPPEVIGKLPRVTCRDCRDKRVTCNQHKKKMCHVCGNHISEAHIHLDYVGHAEATDRLLTVDPEWTWEPYSMDGGPALRHSLSGKEINLWITLTVCGISRIGVGSVENTERTHDAEKQLIGDAIRNAAMRFGMALDLWAKSDLESTLVEDVDTETGEIKASTTKSSGAAKRVRPPAQPNPEPAPAPIEELRALAKAKGYSDAAVLFSDIGSVVGELVDNLDQLSADGIEQFIVHLNKGEAA